MQEMYTAILKITPEEKAELEQAYEVREKEGRCCGMRFAPCF